MHGTLQSDTALSNDTKYACLTGMATKLLYYFLQVAEATDFLARMHPLKHIAPVRKSQVQHAISEMLTGVLKRLIIERAPR